MNNINPLTVPMFVPYYFLIKPDFLRDSQESIKESQKNVASPIKTPKDPETKEINRNEWTHTLGKSHKTEEMGSDKEECSKDSYTKTYLDKPEFKFKHYLIGGP